MRRLLAVILTGVTLASCGGDDSTGLDGTSITGTYELQSVGGEPLPCCHSLSHTPDGFQEMEIEGGTWSLNDDDTWSASFVVHTRILDLAGALVEEASEAIPFGTGSFVDTDGDLLFTTGDGTTYRGSISGRTLTVMLFQDVPAVYRK